VDHSLIESLTAPGVRLPVSQLGELSQVEIHEQKEYARLSGPLPRVRQNEGLARLSEVAGSTDAPTKSKAATPHAMQTSEDVNGSASAEDASSEVPIIIAAKIETVVEHVPTDATKVGEAASAAPETIAVVGGRDSNDVSEVAATAEIDGELTACISFEPGLCC
jgi:hypothetical protein